MKLLKLAQINLEENNIVHSRFKHCPCCNSQEWCVIWDNPLEHTIRDWKDFMYGGRQFIKQIIHCNNCGYRSITWPTQGDEFYTDADRSDYTSLTSARKRYFLEMKKSLYHFSENFNRISSMMDLGAGDGDWLSTWPEVPLRYATEKQPKMIEKMNARGIFTSPSLEACANIEFDLISAFDFLEHVEDPKKLLQSVYERLAVGGSVVIGVPNMGKWLARLLGTRYYLYCPMHYSYFTEKSLRCLLGQFFSQVEIFKSPAMHTNLNGVAKWLFPQLQNSLFDKIWLPLGYSASLIAISQK